MTVEKPVLMCKYCKEVLVERNGILVIDKPSIVFPQYCGFPWPSDQKHTLMKEEETNEYK